MSRLTDYEALLRPILAIALSVFLISGCNSNGPLPTTSESDITSSESVTGTLVSETMTSETEVTETTAGYDPQAVLRYKELIAENEDEDNIPEDLVMKRTTDYIDGNINDVQTILYEDGRIIECDTASPNIYAVTNSKYEYSGDDLIRIYETFGYEDSDVYYKEYVVEIEYGEDQEKKIRTNCLTGETYSTGIRTYKDGLLYEETKQYEDGKIHQHTYEYDGETLVKESSGGGTREYFYDDKGRMIREEYKYSSDIWGDETCIQEWEYDDAGVLLHYKITFEGQKSADESFEDMYYDYIIDNGYAEISRGYVFDDDGNKTGEIKIVTSAYDVHGRKIFRSMRIEGEDKPRYTMTTKNTYDDQGRIIKQESVRDNGEKFKTVEYKYKQ